MIATLRGGGEGNSLYCPLGLCSPVWASSACCPHPRARAESPCFVSHTCLLSPRQAVSRMHRSYRQPAGAQPQAAGDQVPAQEMRYQVLRLTENMLVPNTVAVTPWGVKRGMQGLGVEGPSQDPKVSTPASPQGQATPGWNPQKRDGSVKTRTATLCGRDASQPLAGPYGSPPPASGQRGLLQTGTPSLGT